ncbi:MAG: hypothetical protein J6B28_01630, partial [Eubacterium sp.]|nr:hypothetical protein [Eubacterium sp.]
IPASDSKEYCKIVKLYKKIEKEAVTTATDEMAQQIHDTLSVEKEFVFYTKGKPDKIYKDLCEKVKKINRQGIRFWNEARDEKLLFNDIYQITINKDMATAYAYACKLSEKMFEHRKNGINGQVLKLCDPVTYYSDWPDWLHPAYDEDYDPEWCVPKCSKEEAYEQLRPAEKRIYDAQSMGELSDIVKLYVIDCYDLFAMGARGIIYESKESRWTSFKSDGVIMKHLYNDTARGVCMHYAKSEVILFSYFDIDVKYCSGSNHAWTEGVAKDSYGNKIPYKFDYELLVKGLDRGGYE